MPRKLKTYVTNSGFFELALAAPSMKAALEAWGMGPNIFHQGFAKQTEDPKIIAATTAKPGVVLRRPVGTKGAFTEDTELPKDFGALMPPAKEPAPKSSVRAYRDKKAMAKPIKSAKQERAAILSFEKTAKRREAERQREAAQQAAEQARIERALAKVDAAIEKARDRHEEALANIEQERDKLDRRAEIEKNRWQEELEKLEEARKRARE